MLVLSLMLHPAFSTFAAQWSARQVCDQCHTMFCLRRMLPSKRSMAAALAACGSFAPLLMRYILGSYLPSFQQLASSPVRSHAGFPVSERLWDCGSGVSKSQLDFTSGPEMPHSAIQQLTGSHVHLLCAQRSPALDEVQTVFSRMDLVTCCWTTDQ